VVFSSTRPDLNMLPHTFLTGLEGVRGAEAGVWLAKVKERVREREKRKGGTDRDTSAVPALYIYSQIILNLD